MRVGIVIPPAAFLLDDRAFVFLGPLVIAAVARQAGHEVEVLDLTGHSRSCSAPVHGDACARATLADASRRVADLAARCDVVGCYSMAALHFFVVHFLAAIRAGNPECAAVLGGPHASTAPERCAAEGWDYVVVADQGGGGGEAGFLEVLRRVEVSLSALARGRASPVRPLAALPMLAPAGACQLGPGVSERIVRVPSRDPTLGLYQNDRHPYPARDLIDFASYRYELEGRRYASVVTQTGCPFRCSFCAHHDGYTKMVLRSPGHVDGEIRALKADYPFIGGVMFYDDEINLREDFWDFLDTLKRLHHALDLTWRGFWKSGRKWNTNEDLFRKVAEAGFTHLCTGAESADPEVLRLVGKGATVEDNTNFVRLCAKFGIHMKLFTQIGLPGEKPETAERNARWLEEMAHVGLGLIDADVTVTTPTSGTPLMEKADEWLASGLISFDVAELTSNAEAVNYKGSPGLYKSFVSTPWLTREDVVWWRQHIEDRFRKAAGLAPLTAAGKDDG